MLVLIYIDFKKQGLFLTIVCNCVSIRKFTKITYSL